MSGETKKEKINSYPYVDLPDPIIRYLISDENREAIAMLRFEEDGTPHVRYLKPVSDAYEFLILELISEKRRWLFNKN